MHRLLQLVNAARSFFLPRSGSADDQDTLLRAAYDSAPFGITIMAPDGRFVAANAAYRRMTGFDEDALRAETLETLTHPDDLPRLTAQLQQLLDGRQHVFTIIARYRTRSRAMIWARVTVSMHRDGSDTPLYIISRIEDISDRRQDKALLRPGAEPFDLLVASVTDYAIYMLDPDGRIASWNLGAERIKGYAAHEIIGQHVSRFYLHEDIERGVPERELRDAVEHGRFEDSGWRLRKDGTKFWANVIITPMRDVAGKLRGFAKVTRDLTERKRAERELNDYTEQLRILSQRLVELHEESRLSLSRELHDRVGQNLTALNINLGIVLGQLPAADPAIAARLKDSQELVEATVDVITDVMAELRPPLLDDYGLFPALKSIAEQFSRRTGIDIAMSGPESLERLPKQIEIALCRVAQEALTNVAKHAQARHIQLELVLSDERIGLTVADDGVGFDPRADAADTARSGWGMLTMRERAMALGGDLTINSAPGLGTRVTLTLAR